MENIERDFTIDEIKLIGTLGQNEKELCFSPKVLRDTLRVLNTQGSLHHVLL